MGLLNRSLGRLTRTRAGRALAIGLAGCLAGAALMLWSLPARAADQLGTVKSVAPNGKSMVVTVQGEKGVSSDVRIDISEGSSQIFSPTGEPLSAKAIEPGTPVLVRERVVASEVRVRGRVKGLIKELSPHKQTIVISDEKSKNDVSLKLAPDLAKSMIAADNPQVTRIEQGALVTAITDDHTVMRVSVERAPVRNFIEEFWHNFRHNLFKPLLLFFYMGFLIPVFRVKFEFPYVLYQGLTIYLLISIGWHGGEELAGLEPGELGRAVGLMFVGFVTNFIIGCVAYLLLRAFTRIRRIDAATVAGYYGSDSAGTFVTCVGVLATARIVADAFMPVMLAVMEIPGCLVALYLVSRLRKTGMDPAGNMPDEPGYDPNNPPPEHVSAVQHGGHGAHETSREKALRHEAEMALERVDNGEDEEELAAKPAKKGGGLISAELLHEVLLNPGIYMLFGGILVGFISRRQGSIVTRPDDPFFNEMFQGLLCLFLLEMGMTASRRLRDLHSAGWRFVALGLLMPPVFASLGILVIHTYGMMTHHQFALGSYVLFSVLCGAASYIAVPAVQRIAIPEASPTLPLAASLGLTFTFNVTVGIPIYIGIAKYVMQVLPIGA